MTNNFSDQQDKNKEIEFWNKQAKNYNYVTFEKKVYSAFRINEYVDMINRALKPYNFKPNATVLDLGCSAGVSTIILSKIGYNATGLDISNGLIDQARQLAKEENSQAQFMVGDACSMPFADNSFDILFMVGLIHHFPNYFPFIKEMSRVLKKNGVMVAIEPNLLNWSYRKSFKLVHNKSGVTPNEYPLSPIKLKNDLSALFSQIHIFPFRENDVPFLRQLGWFGKCFLGQIIKFGILLFRRFIPQIKRGTFFILSSQK